MRKIGLIPLFLLLTGLTSCFKEDDQVVPHPRGDVITDTIPLTDNYRYQVWYSLDSAKAVQSNLKSGYDLGFECSASGWHILLNTANFMKAADLGKVPLGNAYDTTGSIMVFDPSDGNMDSTAIGRWFEIDGEDTVYNQHVYAVSRGLDESGNPLGLYQVIFDSLKRNTYYFRYAKLSGGTVFSGSVTKDPLVSFLYFSFESAEVKTIEPNKQTFDLLFTQYTTMLYTDEGIPYPYLVTGVLLNRYNVSALADTLSDFSSIDLNYAKTLVLSGNLDAIGYDWKHYSFETGAYTIRPGLAFIVRSRSGLYYKLRFTGFYDLSGRKGYPVIEFQRL